MAEGGRDRRLPVLHAKLARRLAEGLYTRHLSIGLRRDLAVAKEPPATRIPVSLRPFRDEDMAALFPEGGDASVAAARADVEWRRNAVAQGILQSRCFVLVDERSGQPCHIQWLTEPGYGDAIRRAGALPVLAADEALLENAYTPDAYRGLGIMATAMNLLAGEAAAMGKRYLLVYIDADNHASLKGAERSGLIRWSVRTSRQLGFGLIRTARFDPIAATAVAG
jgi:hypothetical protein